MGIRSRVRVSTSFHLKAKTFSFPPFFNLVRVRVREPLLCSDPKGCVRFFSLLLL